MHLIMYAKCNVCYVVQENKDLHYITLIIIHSAPDKTLQNKDLTNTEKLNLKPQSSCQIVREESNFLPGTLVSVFSYVPSTEMTRRTEHREIYIYIQCLYS